MLSLLAGCIDGRSVLPAQECTRQPGDTSHGRVRRTKARARLQLGVLLASAAAHEGYSDNDDDQGNHMMVQMAGSIPPSSALTLAVGAPPPTGLMLTWDIGPQQKRMHPCDSGCRTKPVERSAECDRPATSATGHRLIGQRYAQKGKCASQRVEGCLGPTDPHPAGPVR